MQALLLMLLKEQIFMTDKMINVGEITGAHGIKGQVKVASLTDFPDIRFAPGSKLYSDKLHKTVQVTSSSVHKGLYLVGLSDINDRDTAQSLLHSYLQVSINDLPPLPDGEYYHFQLVGLQVYEADRLLGEITEVMQTGANDVYVIKAPAGQKPAEILLPALKHCILGVDLAAGKMSVKIPEGLID